MDDVITLSHNNKNYNFNVIKVRPPDDAPEPMEEEKKPMEVEDAMEEDSGEKEKEGQAQGMLTDSDFARQLDAELNGPKEKENEEKKEKEKAKEKAKVSDRDKHAAKEFPNGMYGISILDADITVDVLEPMELVVPITNISFEKSKRIEEKGKLREGDYAYFALLKVPEVPEGNYLIIKVNIQHLRYTATTLSLMLTNPLQVQSPNGDPDMYISNTSENRRPSLLAHTWQSQGMNGTDILQIPSYDRKLQDASASGTPLYIAIHAYKGGEDGNLDWTLSCYIGTVAPSPTYCDEHEKAHSFM